MFPLQGLTIIIDLGSNAVKAGFAQEGGKCSECFKCSIVV